MDQEGQEPRRENLVKEAIPLKGWRKAMADLMLRSHSEYAEVTQMREVDFSEMINLRQGIVADLENRFGVRVSYTHLLLKAAAQALRQHPIVNSSLMEGEIRIWEDINLAMAVSLDDGGLLAPVIRQVDRLSLGEVAQRATKLMEQIRMRKFSLNDLKGGTFTLSNAGMYGTDFVTVLIPTPQSAALGVGRIVPKPVVKNDQIVIRSMMGLSLTYDHRVFAGATAAQFFATLQELIEDPKKVDWGN
jgi:pyruvate/2-oxoglutarate dehydrogenase complex dihydrolipoamide acyltransferase (E2) component